MKSKILELEVLEDRLVPDAVTWAPQAGSTNYQLYLNYYYTGTTTRPDVSWLPTASTIVTFDGNVSNGDCNDFFNEDIGGLVMNSNYTGTLCVWTSNGGATNLTVEGGADLDGGWINFAANPTPCQVNFNGTVHWDGTGLGAGKANAQINFNSMTYFEGSDTLQAAANLKVNNDALWTNTCGLNDSGNAMTVMPDGIMDFNVQMGVINMIVSGFSNLGSTTFEGNSLYQFTDNNSIFTNNNLIVGSASDGVNGTTGDVLSSDGGFVQQNYQGGTSYTKLFAGSTISAPAGGLGYNLMAGEFDVIGFDQSDPNKMRAIIDCVFSQGTGSTLDIGPDFSPTSGDSSPVLQVHQGYLNLGGTLVVHTFLVDDDDTGGTVETGTETETSVTGPSPGVPVATCLSANSVGLYAGSSITATYSGSSEIANGTLWVVLQSVAQNIGDWGSTNVASPLEGPAWADGPNGSWVDVITYGP